MNDDTRSIESTGTDPNERIELTGEERQSLAALPRERDPGQLLEERTVRALRERGYLVASPSRSREADGRAGSVTPGRSWWSYAAAVAAGIALFAGGLSVGQTLGARQTADAFQTVFDESDVRLASQVQRAGSDYVASLVALVEAEGSAADSGQALEVALTALWAASNEIVRLAPNDPLAARILQGFEARDQHAEQFRPGNQLLVEF